MIILERDMATWGSHFRIAENILKKYMTLNRKSFAIGNVGPDCGLPNKDWSVFTPSKEKSHFTIGDVSDFLEIQTDKFILSDVKFYSKYLKDSDLFSPQSDRSFLLGYFIHLITDNLWNYYIMKPLKENYLKELQNNPN
ncbi:MAG: zinc dependent phospholipase C family protein, partial [Candidatus Thorarchaeota archaeon]